MKPTRLSQSLAVLSLFIMTTFQAKAVDRTWDGTTGAWSTPTNWGGDVLPTSSDLAMINNSGTAQLPVGVSGFYNKLRMGNNFYGGSGALEITGGLLSGSESILGAPTGGMGTATVTSGTWSNSSNLTLGYSGTGSLVVNGGLVTNYVGRMGYSSGSVGSATVTSGTWRNSGTLWVGFSGTGSLFVNGGLVTSTSGLISDDTESTGSATVTSGTWSNNQLSVGNIGKGSLLVNGGLVTTSSRAEIGAQTGSEGSATVTSGTWSNADALWVGRSGSGSLLVSGGLVTSASGEIGYSSSGIGNVAVIGEGAMWINSGDMTVGRQGSNNTLTIEDGALVKVGEAIGETISFSTLGGTNNFLRLDGGYIALFGDQTNYIDSLITAGRIQLWDGLAWVTATAADVGITYYTNDTGGEAAALADTGYSGLKNYTVATPQAVPEPSTAALLLLGTSALFLRRQRTS